MTLKERLLNQSAPPPPFSPNDRANLLEVLQRCRRIETRLTRLLELEGVETGIQRPWWVEEEGVVMLPSPMTTIDAIVKIIPTGWSKPVPLVLKDDEGLVIMCRLTP